MIRDEAVEAVARVFYATCGDEPELPENYDGEPDVMKERYRSLARPILKAAAPHMEDPRIDAIAAWCGRHRSGYYDEAQDDVMEIIRTNPYRSQA